MFYYESSDEEDNYSGSTPKKDLENKLIGIMNAGNETTQTPTMDKQNTTTNTTIMEQKKKRMLQALQQQGREGGTMMTGMVQMSRPYTSEGHMRGFTRGSITSPKQVQQPSLSIDIQHDIDDVIIPDTAPNPVNTNLDTSLTSPTAGAQVVAPYPTSMQTPKGTYENPQYNQPSPHSPHAQSPKYTTSQTNNMNMTQTNMNLNQMNNIMNQRNNMNLNQRNNMNMNMNMGQQNKKENKFEEELKKRGLEPTYEPAATRNTETIQRPIAMNPDNVNDFVTRPAPQNGESINCFIIRERGKFKLYPKYYLYLERGKKFLMAARKRKKNKSSNYLISLSDTELNRDSNSYFGKLRSNFLGTEFLMYNKGENPGKCHDPQRTRHQIGAVLYEPNLLGTKGPRKLTIVLPKVDPTNETKHLTAPEQKNGEGIIEQYRRGKWDNVTVFKNKLPEWSEKMNAYVLHFYGRVKKPSVKNFQLIEANKPDTITLQFGKISDNKFALDYSYPLSALQAFLIALSSFDTKFACE